MNKGRMKRYIKSLEHDHQWLVNQLATTIKELGETKAILTRTVELGRRDAVDWVQDEGAYIAEINDLKAALAVPKVRVQPYKAGDTIRITCVGDDVRVVWEGVVSESNGSDITLGSSTDKWTMEIGPDDTVEVL